MSSDYAKNVAKMLSQPGFVKDYANWLNREQDWDTDDLADALTDITGSVSVMNHRGTLYAYDSVNLDGPYYDDVVEKAAKLLKVDEEAIKSYYTEMMHGDEINDRIQRDMYDSGSGFYLDQKLEYVGDGRGSNYEIGVEFDYDWFEIDPKKLAGALKKSVVRGKLFDELLDDLDYDPEEDDRPTDDELIDSLYNVLDVPSRYGDWKLPWDELIKLTSEGEKEMEKLAENLKALSATINDVDMMAETIEANEWYNKPDESVAKVAATLDDIASKIEKYDRHLAAEVDAAAQELRGAKA